MVGGWLVGWSVGWLAGWMVGWLAGWLDGWLVDWLAAVWLVGWLIGCASLDHRMNFTAVTSMAASATRLILFRAWLYPSFAAVMARLGQKTYTD